MASPGQTVTRPADDGFYLPAEWCRHSRTWAAWPTAKNNSTNDLEGLKNALAHLVQTIQRYEPVTVLAAQDERAEIIDRCGPQIDVLTMPHDSIRLRDTGPTFLVDGKGGSAATDWQFDGWSERAENWQLDATLTHSLLGEIEVRRFRAPLKLEGSAYCTDGIGTLLASSTAVLDENRNPGVSKLDAFDILSRWLGVSRVIWIDETLGNDFGNGEVRRACTFVAPGHIIVNQADSDPLRSSLDALSDSLANTEDARGERLRVDRIPIAELRGRTASYTTFYVFNQAVLAPQYGIASDEPALNALKKAFPGREIIGVDATPFFTHEASLSSLLQYQPARLLERHKATLLPRSAWQQPAPD
ncbi:MAG: hypothetical protein GKS03_09255, partial [Alphaproteobacteria bacterium]|nr:hypothetical protein [Alphaproteobacteria bacterium]